MEAFWDTLLGKQVLAAEAQALRPVFSRLFGRYLLTVGSPPQLALGEASRFAYQLLMVSAEVGTETAWDALQKINQSSHDIQVLAGDADAFPITPNSIDVVLLPHVLEGIADTETVLREAALSLKSEGTLLLLGFNPISWFSLKRLMRGKKAPWRGVFRPLFQVARQLQQCQLDVCETKYFFYRWPAESRARLERLRAMEWIGRWCYPFAGGVYLIVARKRLWGVTPLRTRWAEAPQKAVPRHYAAPIKRETSHE